ncbi:MAG: hypothetical protein MZV63_67630 [Marinilabiliales bacterium]|nr:hypothetical protein [Marinilabiliales bacterium]
MSTANNLKLRLSYGAAGAGNNNIPSGQIAQTFNSGSTFMDKRIYDILVSLDGHGQS